MKSLKNNFAFDISTSQLRIYKAGRQLIETPTEINFDNKLIKNLIVNGRIAEFNATQILLRQELQKLQKPILGFLYPSFTSLVSVPSERNEVSIRAFRDSMQQLGFRDNLMIHDCFVAAVGLDVFSDNFSANIIDFGAGKTSITTVYRGGIIKNEMFDISGSYLDQAIQTYFSNNYDLIIELKDAEKLKIEFVDIRENFNLHKSICVQGVNKNTKSKTTISIQSIEISNYLKDHIEWLLDRIARHYDDLEDEVLKEIKIKGSFIIGGAAKLRGLIDLIAKKINVSPKSYNQNVDFMKVGLEKIQSSINQYDKYLMK